MISRNLIPDHVQCKFPILSGFAIAGQQSDLIETGIEGFFDYVSDHRSVDHGQYFFRYYLVGRQYPGVETS